MTVTRSYSRAWRIRCRSARRRESAKMKARHHRRERRGIRAALRSGRDYEARKLTGWEVV